jgi:hypothetical protein
MDVKGENWSKYMKELQELQPLLRKQIGGADEKIIKNDWHPILSAGGVPLNDPTVVQRKKNEILDKTGQALNAERKAAAFKIVGGDGEEISSTRMKVKNTYDKIQANKEKIAAYFQRTINEWVEPHMREIFTAPELRAIQEGQRWPFKRKKVKVEIEHKKDPLPFGSDLVMIIRKKQVVAHQVFRWEMEDEA